MESFRTEGTGDAKRYGWTPTTDSGSSSLLIEGTAEASLSFLLSEEAFAEQVRGKVKLCYIDPPFNTGESFVHYSDRLGRTEWRDMLRESMSLVRDLLSDDGSIWLHLDDSQQHIGRLLLDEVFGKDSFVSTVIWQKRTTRENRTAFSSAHDQIHVYAKRGPKHWKKVRNGVDDTGTFSNPDGDPRGPWRSAPMTAQAGHGTESQFYTVVSPAGIAHEPPPGRCWTFNEDRLRALDVEGRVHWPSQGYGKPRLKTYESDVNGLAPFTIWPSSEVGDTAGAKRSLRMLFPTIPTFDTPKPEALLERIIQIGSNPGDIVLDCFLGSGTTAVVAQRTQRRWIGVEVNRHTIDAFVVPRLKLIDPNRNPLQIQCVGPIEVQSDLNLRETYFAAD